MKTVEELKEFESWCIKTYHEGKIRSPIHLSGSKDDVQEKALIEIFKEIKPNDWVFSTYRSHYHALLKGIPEDWLKNWILENKSIHVMNKEYKFITSAIVGGCLPIAVGVAMGIKMKQTNKKLGIAKKDLKAGDKITINLNQDDSLYSEEINNFESTTFNDYLNIKDKAYIWCFIGDMTASLGTFNDCLSYSLINRLPIKFIIENNGLSTDTPTNEAWGIKKEKFDEWIADLEKNYPDYVKIFKYERIYPHYGVLGKDGKKVYINFDKKQEMKT